MEVDTNMSEVTEKTTALVQRDEHGRILPGSQLAKGRANPTASRVLELKRAMLDAVNPTIMTEMTNRLIDLCRSEDGKIALQALELFLNRILGKPKESIELDVTNTDGPAMPNNLDAVDLAALEAIRRKLQADVIDAEVIQVTPNGDR